MTGPLVIFDLLTSFELGVLIKQIPEKIHKILSVPETEKRQLKEAPFDSGLNIYLSEEVAYVATYDRPCCCIENNDNLLEYEIDLLDTGNKTILSCC